MKKGWQILKQRNIATLFYNSQMVVSFHLTGSAGDVMVMLDLLSKYEYVSGSYSPAVSKRLVRDFNAQ